MVSKLLYLFLLSFYLFIFKQRGQNHNYTKLLSRWTTCLQMIDQQRKKAGHTSLFK